MDNRNAYLRERRRLSATGDAAPRLIPGSVGGVVAALIPLNPTTLPDWVFALLRAVGGFVIADRLVFLYRFFWSAPLSMHVDALKRIAQADTRATNAVEDNDRKWVVKTDVYRKSIEGLQRDLARRDATILALEQQLDARKRNQAFADLLTERYTYGLNSVMNWERLTKGQSFTEADFNEWLERERTWTASVRNLLELHGCSQQEIAHFWAIHDVPVRQFHHFFHVSQQLSMFSERLNRLKSIINEYAEVKILT